jgi:hypothetical protein
VKERWTCLSLFSTFLNSQAKEANIERIAFADSVLHSNQQLLAGN